MMAVDKLLNRLDLSVRDDREDMIYRIIILIVNDSDVLSLRLGWLGLDLRGGRRCIFWSSIIIVVGNSSLSLVSSIGSHISNGPFPFSRVGEIRTVRGWVNEQSEGVYWLKG